MEEQGLIIDLEELEIEYIDYRTWVPFQGNLKVLYKKNFQKLLESFKRKKGFVPAFIWKHDGNNFLLDGHQRKALFEAKKLRFKRKNGSVGYEYPCVIIEAENGRDAAERLLVITSQYGTITQEGLYELQEIFGIDDTYLHEAVNFDSIYTDLVGDLEPEEEKESKPSKPKYKIVINCESEEYQNDVRERLLELAIDFEIKNS